MKQSGRSDFPNEVALQELNRNMTIKIGNWKPPQRPQWVKAYMQIPGPMRVQLLLLLILTTSSVLSTGLQISRTVGNISGGSTSSKNESLEVADAGGRVRVTGRHTTDLLRNLMVTGNAWGRIPLPEKSSQPMPQQEE